MWEKQKKKKRTKICKYKSINQLNIYIHTFLEFLCFDTKWQAYKFVYYLCVCVLVLYVYVLRVYFYFCMSRMSVCINIYINEIHTYADKLKHRLTQKSESEIGEWKYWKYKRKTLASVASPIPIDLYPCRVNGPPECIRIMRSSLRTLHKHHIVCIVLVIILTICSSSKSAISPINVKLKKVTSCTDPIRTTKKKKKQQQRNEKKKRGRDKKNTIYK